MTTNQAAAIETARHILADYRRGVRGAEMYQYMCSIDDLVGRFNRSSRKLVWPAAVRNAAGESLRESR